MAEHCPIRWSISWINQTGIRLNDSDFTVIALTFGFISASRRHQHRQAASLVRRAGPDSVGDCGDHHAPQNTSSWPRRYVNGDASPMPRRTWCQHVGNQI
jgi:hypothetical protein